MKTPTLHRILVVLAVIALTGAASCSKRISPTDTSKNTKIRQDSALVAAQPVANPVLIDTSRVVFTNRVSSVSSDPYYRNRVETKIGQFYRANGFRTKWLYDHAPGDLYYSVLDILKSSAADGLFPDDYDVAGIEASVNALYRPEIGTREIEALDLHISEMYFLYTTHLMEGRIRNVSNGKNIWKRISRELTTSDVDMLAGASSPVELKSIISRMQPAREQYVKLQQALAYYRALEAASGRQLPAVSVKSAVKPGEQSAAIPLIRKKLSITDSTVLRAGITDSLFYDEGLVSAIKKFQDLHGLQPDGVIGEKTLRFLNQHLKEKADVIALNMERLRWLPSTYSDRFIVVNIPEFKLRVYNQEKKEIEMKVIVGSSSKPTPVFTEQLEHIVFSPTWTVPVSIIREEIIPHLRKDSAYYSSKNYLFYKNGELIDPLQENWKDEMINPYLYRVVQNPGSDNSLGSVKFMMPNNLSVYLHDTPNHRLFSKDYRALSHGCIRLDEPARFAEYLLKDQKGWTPERITKAMNDSLPSTIHLKRYYEVHLEYQTAWVDEQGNVNFREDIYGHDRVQLKQLMPATTVSASVVGLK